TMKSSLDRTLAGSSIAGTLEYAAPEQMGKLKGVAVGAYSDVYGFAKTCCFALFGTPQPTFQHWQKLPPNLADLLGRCLSEQPRERTADLAAVLRELDRLAAPQPQPQPRRAREPEIMEAEPVVEELVEVKRPPRPRPRPAVERRRRREEEEEAPPRGRSGS